MSNESGKIPNNIRTFIKDNLTVNQITEIKKTFIDDYKIGETTIDRDLAHEPVVYWRKKLWVNFINFYLPDNKKTSLEDLFPEWEKSTNEHPDLTMVEKVKVK